jgi:hypothetical protein
MRSDFSEQDEEAVAEAFQFLDLFASQETARMVAWDLWTKARAACELRREASGRLIGVYPIDTTTLKRLADGDYEQAVTGVAPIRIPNDAILWLTAIGRRQWPMTRGLG